MAHFRHIGGFAGKGQGDLDQRVRLLVAMGEPEPARNPFHPHLYSRADVKACEERLGVTWLCGRGCYVRLAASQTD